MELEEAILDLLRQFSVPIPKDTILSEVDDEYDTEDVHRVMVNLRKRGKVRYIKDCGWQLV